MLRVPQRQFASVCQLFFFYFAHGWFSSWIFYVQYSATKKKYALEHQQHLVLSMDMQNGKTDMIAYYKCIKVKEEKKSATKSEFKWSSARFAHWINCRVNDEQWTVNTSEKFHLLQHSFKLFLNFNQAQWLGDFSFRKRNGKYSWMWCFLSINWAVNECASSIAQPFPFAFPFSRQIIETKWRKDESKTFRPSHSLAHSAHLPQQSVIFERIRFSCDFLTQK